MGALRFVLAFGVVFSHVGWPNGYRFIGGPYCVQSFYILSGFLITMALRENYDDLKKFYVSRALRIYPAYFVWLLIALTFFVARLTIGHEYSGPLTAYAMYADKMSLATHVWLAISQVAIIGQDAALFIAQRPDGSSFFTAHFLTEQPPGGYYWYFFIPQAWSLSIELLFYLLAPFIVTRFWSALLVLVLAFSLRTALAAQGLVDDPWLYRFFPTELGTFMIGALSYYLMKSTRDYLSPRWSFLGVALVIGLALAFEHLPKSHVATTFFTDAQVIFYVALFLLLPLCFVWSKGSRIDRFLGDLSYPVYLCHFTVAQVVGFFWPGNSGAQLAFVVAAVFIASSATWFLIDRPIDTARALAFRRKPSADDRAVQMLTAKLA